MSNERSALIPELFLDLANSLIYLPDKSWAREQLNSSVRYWLSLRGVTTYSSDLLDLLEATRSFLTLQDKDYLEKIKQCLVRLGDTQGVQKVTDLWLNTVEEAERIHQQQKVEEAERIRRLQDEKLRLLREQAEEQARQKLLEEEKSKVLIITLPNGIKLELVKIPAGSFMMGSNNNDDEKPIHKVTLKEFYLGKYPVTQEQYQAVMGNNPSRLKDNPKNPVEQVSWDDVKEFCRKLKQITGKDFRLPTEAEWEYGCRAGSQIRYYFGDNENQLGEYAWFDQNSDSKNHPHPVGLKKPNAWGLYDMSGNVWEWCEDPWHDSYAKKPDNIKNNENTIWSDSNESMRLVVQGVSLGAIKFKQPKPSPDTSIERASP